MAVLKRGKGGENTSQHHTSLCRPYITHYELFVINSGYHSYNA